MSRPTFLRFLLVDDPACSTSTIFTSTKSPLLSFIGVADPSLFIWYWRQYGCTEGALERRRSSIFTTRGKEDWPLLDEAVEVSKAADAVLIVEGILVAALGVDVIAFETVVLLGVEEF
jgi:hypothetical protein